VREHSSQAVTQADGVTRKRLPKKFCEPFLADNSQSEGSEAGKEAFPTPPSS